MALLALACRSSRMPHDVRFSIVAARREARQSSTAVRDGERGS
jgi:hypothetical protein